MGEPLTPGQRAVLDNVADGAMFSHLVWLPGSPEPQPEAAAAIILDFFERGWVGVYEFDEGSASARLLSDEEAELAIGNSSNWVIADAEGVAPYEVRATAAAPPPGEQRPVAK